MDQLSHQPITLKTSQLSVTEDDADKSVGMDTLRPTGWTLKTHQISLVNEDDRTAVDGEFSTESRCKPVGLDIECELESSFLYQYPTGTGNKQIRVKLFLQTSFSSTIFFSFLFYNLQCKNRLKGHKQFSCNYMYHAYCMYILYRISRNFVFLSEFPRIFQAAIHDYKFYILLSKIC
jgi:hypothetical protein